LSSNRRPCGGFGKQNDIDQKADGSAVGFYRIKKR